MITIERADWLGGAFDSSQARFLLVTAITHHRFTSPTWGEHEVRKLYTELAEIELFVKQAIAASPVRPGMADEQNRGRAE